MPLWIKRRKWKNKLLKTIGFIQQNNEILIVIPTPRQFERITILKTFVNYGIKFLLLALRLKKVLVDVWKALVFVHGFQLKRLNEIKLWKLTCLLPLVASNWASIILLHIRIFLIIVGNWKYLSKSAWERKNGPNWIRWSRVGLATVFIEQPSSWTKPLKYGYNSLK